MSGAPENHPGTNVRKFKPKGAAPPSSDFDGLETGGPPSPPTDAPTIRIVNGEIERIVDEAEAALIASDRGLYQRVGRIVCVGDVKITASDQSEGISQRILDRGDYSLVEDLTAAANFQRYDGRKEEWVTRDAPMSVAKTLRERGSRLRLPVLTGITNAPTIRPDGSVLDRPGYDAATGLLYDPRGALFPKVPLHPTAADGRAALAMIEDLFDTMPFKNDVDRAVAVSAVLTACSRNAYPTAPMHAMTAPTAGSGKSMIVDAATMVATGRRAAVLALGKKEEETEKRLVGALLSGDPILALDNCEVPVGGDLLCQILTQVIVRVRALGGSPITDLPTNLFVTATGNNLVVLGDMTRRTLICTIDPKTERPELRVFDKPDPVTRAQQHRAEYITAALTVLRAYFEAGRPIQKPALGSFDGWSRTVRDALIWLGSADPTVSMEEGRRNDPRLAQLGAVLAQWRQAVGFDQVTTNQVIELARRKPPYGEIGKLEYPEFHDALLAVAGAGGAIDGKRLGTWLGRNKDRVFDGYLLGTGSMRNGINTWRLFNEGSPEWTPG